MSNLSKILAFVLSLSKTLQGDKNLNEPDKWMSTLTQQLQDMLIMRGAHNIINFPRERNHRIFSVHAYNQTIAYQEVLNRPWLVYSISMLHFAFVANFLPEWEEIISGKLVCQRLEKYFMAGGGHGLVGVCRGSVNAYLSCCFTLISFLSQWVRDCVRFILLECCLFYFFRGMDNK